MLVLIWGASSALKAEGTGTELEQTGLDCGADLPRVVAIPDELDLGHPVRISVDGLRVWLACRKRNVDLRLFLGGRVSIGSAGLRT
jgi:hypothetical protein